MFDSLSDKLQSALDGLKSQGKLTEKDIERAAREIRLAILLSRLIGASAVTLAAATVQLAGRRGRP